MARLTPSEIIAVLTAIAIMLTLARTLGEIAKRFNQPSVLGEMLAGIFLGPTVLGALFPHFTAMVFPTDGHAGIALDGLTTLAVVLFLLVAGMEVNLSTVWRQGKTALLVSSLGIIVPFSLGFAIAWYGPSLIGYAGHQDPLIFSLFIATALSISALPVIAKTLMDLNLYRSDFGMLIIASAIFNDLVGWIIFAIILAMMGAGVSQGPGIANTIWMTIVFAVAMLTIGKSIFHRFLPWLQAHTSWPGGVLSFSLAVAMFGAAFTEWLGIHAIFGSFLVGVALGDSSHLREQTRATIDRFVSFIFAPLFFASIGLKVNFIANFDPLLVLVVLIIAILGKLVGCGGGAYLSRMPLREALAVGFGMNARGAMEIILGLLALQFDVITERLFVALVVMALITSMMSGPMIQFLLRHKKTRRLTDFLAGRAILPNMKSVTCQEAIAELMNALLPQNPAKAAQWIDEVWKREQVLPTGIGHCLAVPHARLDGLSSPLIGVGISKEGIDFDAPDGLPARIIFLLLTPKNDNGLQLEILADIARTFSDEGLREKVLNVSGYTEFLALVKSERKE